uniref:Vipericidin n=1 Tax=Oryctolagus cuniculus TaxID=9986 RepID=G1TM30_RABIT
QPDKMQGVTTAGLLLLLLGLACAESKTWTKDTTLSQSETLNIIVNDLNNQSNEEYAFRVLDAHPRPDWDPTFSDPQLVIFTIRETECRKKNLSLEQCPFKDNGKEKTCWGHAKPVDEGLRVMVSCQSQKSGEVSNFQRSSRGQRDRVQKVRTENLGWKLQMVSSELSAKWIIPLTSQSVHTNVPHGLTCRHTPMHTQPPLQPRKPRPNEKFPANYPVSCCFGTVVLEGGPQSSSIGIPWELKNGNS